MDKEYLSDFGGGKLFRESIISLVLCGVLLLIVSILAVAQGGGKELNQTGMETPIL
jgi:hypothetical protein